MQLCCGHIILNGALGMVNDHLIFLNFDITFLSISSSEPIIRTELRHPFANPII
jgi:hypothetical protein